MKARSDGAPRWCSRGLAAFLVLYAVFGALTVEFFPSFSWPHGDEGTYLSYARNPLALTSEFFEGFPPKEVVNPYNFRLFLTPFALVFAVFGFTHVGARLVVLAYGLVLLALAYRLGARCGSAPLALASVVLLGCSPPFLFFTHGIRPEGMMSMCILLIAWMVVRRRDGPTVATWACVAFVSSCTLMIHYNGVILPPIFFGALLYHDRGNITRRKLLAYGAGGASFLLLFGLVNVLPAWSTLREYGVLPVTYVSSNQVPLTQTLDPVALVGRAWEYYSRYFRGLFWLEPRTWWFTTALLPAAATGWLYRSSRAERTLGVVFVSLVLAMIFVLPNLRQEYLFYITPLVFVSAGQGLARLRTGWPRAIATAALFGTVWCAYLDADSRYLTRFGGYREANRETARELRALVGELGRDREVTVMGCQEFSHLLPETRFRTFHSMIPQASLRAALDGRKPDVVIVHDRATLLIARFARVVFPRLTYQQQLDVTNRQIAAVMREAGYEVHGDGLRWDSGPVTVYVRK